MTSKLTRERLAKIKSWRETYGAGSNVMLPSEEAEELACLALAAMDSEPAMESEQLALENLRSAMEGIGHIRRTLEETFGGLHGTHVEPDVLAECKAICDAIYAAYRHAQPAPVVPNGLRLALSNAGIAAPESDEMLAATCEKHIQALVTWVKDRKPFQSAPVVPSFEEWLSAANRKPLGWVKDAMREAYDACRAAMLQGAENAESRCGIQTAPALDSFKKNSESRCGNSPVIPEGLIAAVNRLLDSDGSRGCYSAIQCGDAHDEIERLLAAAPQEVK